MKHPNIELSDLLKMELHDDCEPLGTISVLRVPGGWIYSIMFDCEAAKPGGWDQWTSTFVPEPKMEPVMSIPGISLVSEKLRKDIEETLNGI